MVGRRRKGISNPALRSWKLEGGGGEMKEPVHLTMAYPRVVNLKEGHIEHSEL
jgi:hypothetical protein